MSISVKQLINTLLIFVIVAVSGCAERLPPPPPLPPIPYRPLPPQQKWMLNEIRHYGVKVFKQGDVLRVILPTDKFFVVTTTQVKYHSRYALKLVAKFVHAYAQGFHRPYIGVYGYTDTVYSPMKRQKLSQQYAAVVASYLWNAGVSSRYLHVKGFGAKQPVASNLYPQGAHFNRRVEILVH